LLYPYGICSQVVISVAVAWALYALACQPTAHAKLTAEARAYHTDTPSMDELNGMTYLDYVTREVLRLHSPVQNTVRAPMKDTVVPLSEPFIDRHGVKRHELRQVNTHCSAVLPYILSLIKNGACIKKGTRRRHNPPSDSGHSQTEIVVG
jgi:hypothetical protein